VILELLHDAGIQQIIPPIKTIHGQPTQRIEDFTLIVYPFVKGQDGFSRNLTDNQWLKLGKTLRQVHETPGKELNKGVHSGGLRGLAPFLECGTA
jgi:spectinomycin phosphotransferase